MRSISRFPLCFWFCLILLVGPTAPLWGWEAVPPPAKKTKVKRRVKKQRKNMRRLYAAPHRKTAPEQTHNFWRWVLHISIIILTVLVLAATVITIIYCVFGMIWFVGWGWDVLFPILIMLLLFAGGGAVSVLSETPYIPDHYSHDRPDYASLLGLLSMMVIVDLFVLGLMLGLVALWAGILIALGVGLLALCIYALFWI